MELKYLKQSNENETERQNRFREWEQLFDEVISPEMDKTGKCLYDVVEENGITPPDSWGTIHHNAATNVAENEQGFDKSDQVLFCGDCLAPISECGH